jgi:uncharacterized protein
MRGRAAPHAALFALVFACFFLAVGDGLADMRRDKLTLVTSTGKHVFDVEIAETPEDKARGLMFRRSLADDAGMLFPYGPPPQEATMWMRNTYISLDMVFIRGDGIVHRIEHGTEPFSERVISSEGPVSAVLELKAGIANRIGLKPGDRVVHATFKP